MGVSAADHPEAANPETPEPGQLVAVRDRRWIVQEVDRSGLDPDPLSSSDTERQHLVTLVGIDDDSFGEDTRLVWELEPAARVIASAQLPPLDPTSLDGPGTLDAFLDAVRWGAITSADALALQAPFRSGIEIEDYQLDPVVRALRMPRATLLIADDVGLGKTIEAGLVAQELILRHRARSILVVCPAPLQTKWRQEMREKFGLAFEIVDTDLLRRLRRERGLHVNPWTHFPRLITSIDWLKRDRPMSLLREVLPPHPMIPRRFDLLVVDEVHNAAPAGGGERYGTDTLRTKAIRTLAPHCEHRLFLSATPHNGYPNSFSALLELLDPQRFARGVPPDREQLAAVMVRRLKSEIVNPDGSRRFPRRDVEPIEVTYPEEEQAAHADLAAYAGSRSGRAAVRGEGARTAAEFVLLLLKKRLFSSPLAFAHTLEQHQRTLAKRAGFADCSPSVQALLRHREQLDIDLADDRELDEAEREALEVASGFGDALNAEEAEHLARLNAWAERAARREDAKCTRLLDWLDVTLRPGGVWNDERVIVFSEYRDTQRYVRERLAARGVPAERVAAMHGGMDEDDREHIKAAFQAAPDLDPVRILVATDSASEGIDLQNHCHRLVHYEIPWNPNRLEQRNGRVDRHGQRRDPVLIYHFVGAGWRDARPGTLEGASSSWRPRCGRSCRSRPTSGPSVRSSPAKSSRRCSASATSYRLSGPKPTPDRVGC